MQNIIKVSINLVQKAPNMKKLLKKTVGVVVVTHCAKHHLPKCLPPLLKSPIKPRVLVVNSSSNDGTVELAKKMGAETLVIPRAEFNHGLTREKARQHLQTDIIVMITPDAYCVNHHVVGTLITPILRDKASIAYARQLPHEGADFFESFLREYNYPAESHVRGLRDRQKYGAYTYFCSNSCAAYCNKALDDVGGFPEVLIGEDTVVVSKLLNKGHRIAYVAEAMVKHSHRYNLKQEFQRHFDTGLARKKYQDLIKKGGRDEKRGAEYVLTLFKKLMKEKPLLIPYAAVQTAVKLVGYRIGRWSYRAPNWFKKTFSAQDFYWSKDDAGS